MLESAILKWGKKVSTVFLLALRVDDIAIYSCHVFWVYGGLGLFVCFNNSLFLSQHGKDSSHPESQHWKALTCPQYPGLTVYLYCYLPRPTLFPSAFFPGPGQPWGLAYLRKVDNRMERTTDAFYASSWDCVGVFLYLILDCLGRYFLLYVFSVAECTRGQDFTSFA